MYGKVVANGTSATGNRLTLFNQGITLHSYFVGQSVTTKEVSEALKKKYNIDLPKTRLERAEPIKSFGTYQVKAKLYTEIQGVVTVKVEEA